MKIWYVIFADEPRSEAVHQTWEGWPGALSQFEAARHTGVINGRYVTGMWVVDEDTPGADVVERHGRVPPHIKERHEARQRAQARKKPVQLSMVPGPRMGQARRIGKILEQPAAFDLAVKK